MSNSIFPTGITHVMNALNLSTNIHLLVILEQSGAISITVFVDRSIAISHQKDDECSSLYKNG
jgi:aspartate oxidase